MTKYYLEKTPMSGRALWKKDTDGWHYYGLLYDKGWRQMHAEAIYSIPNTMFISISEEEAFIWIMEH